MENGVLIFYFTAPVTELLRILVCCFLTLLPHQNKPNHNGVIDTVCINRTMKVPSIIKDNGTDSKLFLFLK